MAQKKTENQTIKNVVENDSVNIKQNDINSLEVPVITLDMFKEKVAIKNKISFLEKQAIVQLIYDNCVIQDEENGTYFIDTIMQKVNYNLAILGAYTDYYNVIENAENYGYDYLNELGIFDYVLSIVKNDVSDIDYAVRYIGVRVESLNSVGSVLYRAINNVLSKMPTVKDMNKIINNLPKIINKIDKETLDVFAKSLQGALPKNQNITTQDNTNKINRIK